MIAFLSQTGICAYALSIYTQSLQNCLGHNLVKEKFIKSYVTPKQEYFAESNVQYHAEMLQNIF